MISKNVMLICGYAAPYKGNFIPSLECLEDRYKEGRMVYLFPENARQVSWMADFQKNHKVYFINIGFFSKIVNRSILKTLRTILKEEIIEIIHTHFLVYNYSLFVAKHTFARNIRIIAHIHNQFLIPPTRSALIKKYIMEHTYDIIVGVSKSVAEGLNTQIKHNDIRYIDNAICFSRLDNYEEISLRDNYNQKVVLMAGWPAYVKGVDIAAKAVEQLRNEGYDIKLCVMTSGDFEQTKSCVSEAIGSFPNWVQILSPREDIATYYNAADIFLSASRTEAFSYCLVEAAYCKPMLITSNVPGPNDLQIDGMERFISCEVQSLAQKLRKLLKTRAIAITRRKNVLSIYDLNKWVSDVINLYC